jgi:hypothetical protein
MFRRLATALASESHHSLTLRLTLLVVILHGTTSPFAAVVVRVLGVVMLLLPSLVTQARGFWWVLALSLVVSNADQWELVDNHQYLMTYWVLACTLTLTNTLALRQNARMLVAVAFGLAVIWKLLRGEYIDGSFFYLTLMTDGRIRDVAAVVASGGTEITAAGRAIGQLELFGSDGSTLAVPDDSRLWFLALGLCWMGLLVEAAVATLHMLPSHRLYLWRHASLMGFVAFTYFLLPVVGFGFLLGVMGFSQVGENDERLKRVYVVLLCFLQLSLVPWRNLLSG